MFCFQPLYSLLLLICSQEACKSVHDEYARNEAEACLLAVDAVSLSLDTQDRLFPVTLLGIRASKTLVVQLASVLGPAISYAFRVAQQQSASTKP